MFTAPSTDVVVGEETSAVSEGDAFAQGAFKGPRAACECRGDREQIVYRAQRFPVADGNEIVTASVIPLLRKGAICGDAILAGASTQTSTTDSSWDNPPSTTQNFHATIGDADRTTDLTQTTHTSPSPMSSPNRSHENSIDTSSSD